MYVHTASGNLHYDVTDETQPWRPDGAPIAFHHGVGACADLWRGWVPALCDRHRLIRFDMRGHGRSKEAHHGQWSLSGMVADFAAVIDAVTTDPVHIVGESVGGTVALAYALSYPERVRTLTVSNGAHRGGKVQNLESWAALMGREGMAGWSRYMMEQRFHPGAISRAAATWFEQQQASALPNAVLDAVAVLVDTDLSGRLAELRMPVLLLHPDASPFIPVSVMATLADGVAGSRLHVFSNSRHGLPFSHATPCSQLLREFLASVE
ncbi:MAG: alpha/beta hydrolase [Pseudomonadota bacterium]